MCTGGIPAAGISAVQIGSLKRIFLMKGNDEFIVVCNPEILFHSKEKDFYLEGCLSIDNEYYWIERSTKIKVQYQNEKGELVKRTLKNMTARIFQHEMDHLDGILMMDRALFDEALINTLLQYDDNSIVLVNIELKEKDIEKPEFLTIWTNQLLKKHEYENNTYKMTLEQLKDLSERNLEIKGFNLVRVINEVPLSDY